MKRAARTRALWLASLALGPLLALGCGPLVDPCAGALCEACAPALTLRLTGPSGGPVSEVTVSEGASAQCQAAEQVTLCTISPSRAGEYQFVVSAPGHKPQTVSTSVAPSSGTGCCSCGYEPRTLDVQLQAQ
jgi:hypothetical protein